MPHRTRLAGLTAALLFGLAAPAGAQVFIGGYYGPSYRYAPPPVEIDEGVEPEDVPVIVRRAGFRPVGRVIEGPTTYRVEAIDREGRRVNVVVDSDSGRIITVRPTRGSEAPPPASNAPAVKPTPKAKNAAPAQAPMESRPVIMPPKDGDTPKPSVPAVTPEKKSDRPPAIRNDGPKADESPAPAPPAKASSPPPEAPKADVPKADDPKPDSATPAPEKKSESPASPSAVRVVGPAIGLDPKPDVKAGEVKSDAPQGEAKPEPAKP